MNSFESARIKLDRAKQIGTELDTSVDNYIKSVPTELETEANLRTRIGTTKVRIKKPVPPMIGAIVGDILHNLRSALDTLIYDVSRNHSDFQPNSTSFPIYGNRSGFERKAFTNGLRFSPQSIQLLVQDLQPWKEGHPWLWLLHMANIEDKHRLLTPVASIVKNIDIGLSIKHPSSDEMIKLPQIFLKPADKSQLRDGDPIWTAPLDLSEEISKSEPVFRFELCFDETAHLGGLTLGETLGPIWLSVEEIIHQFQSTIERIEG